MSTRTEIEQVKKILTTLVGFDTTSRNANRPMIDWVHDYLKDYGVASTIVASDDGSKACLWATVGAPDQRGIVLAGHSDVVPVDDQNWASDPFTLREEGGKWYGRGAADMKGFIACALAFVPEFLAAGHGGCFHIAITSDEETDMSGATRLTQHLSDLGVKPQWIWVGEPTLLQIVDQHKGVAAYETKFTGVSGHSGQPDKGLNAIELAADFMQVVAQVAQAKKVHPFTASAFDPAYTTFNLGTVKGGSAENIIAGACDLVWQVRVHPGDSAQATATDICDRAEAMLAPRLQRFLGRAKVETCTCFDIPPFAAQPDSPATRTLKRHLKCDATHAVGFATEAGIFQKLGVSAVVCGPGSIDQAHQPDEFIEINQISSFVDLMRAVLLSSLTL